MKLDFFEKGVLFLTVLVVVLVWTSFAFGDSVGFTFNKVDTDTSFGVVAEGSFHLGKFGIEADGQLQSGDLYRGKYHSEVNFPLSATVLAKLFTDGYVKGSSLAGLGNVNDFGVGIELPAVGAVTWGFGIFGRTAGPFAKPNAVDDLVPLGYNEGYLESLGLRDVHPDPTGLSIKPANSLNALVFGAFDYRGWHVKVSALPELSPSDNPVHQLLWEFSTDVELVGAFDVQFAFDVGLQTFNDTIEHEQAFLVTLGYDFD